MATTPGDYSAALQNLLTRNQQITDWLAGLAVGVLPDLPQAEGGGNVNWPQWIKERREELKSNMELIAIFQGPYEILQQGMT